MSYNCWWCSESHLGIDCPIREVMHRNQDAIIQHRMSERRSQYYPGYFGWCLWVDDQIDDKDTPIRHTPFGWIGAKSVSECKTLVEQLGMPARMSLDHDLGPGGEVPEFLKWLFERFPDRSPPAYTVHSKNVVGVPNIVSYLESWKKSRELP